MPKVVIAWRLLVLVAAVASVLLFGGDLIDPH
jgi:hypothetical protein